jgi:hypothetical protein
MVEKNVVRTMQFLARLRALQRNAAIVQAGFSWRGAVLFVALFLAVLYYGFSHNHSCMEIGLDGAGWRTYFAYQREDRELFTQTGADPMQGSFDAYYRLFPEYLLPSALTLLFAHALPGKVFSYFVYTAFLMLAVYLGGRAVRADRPTALLGAFLMALLAPPSFVNHYSELYGLFSLNPHWAENTALSVLIIAALWAIAGSWRLRTFALVVVPSLCLVIGVLGLAPHVIFMVPAVAFYGAASLVVGRGWRENLPRLAAAFLAVAVPVALGIATYYYTSVKYSAYDFFAGDFGPRPVDAWTMLSTMFWSDFGWWTIVLGVAGAAWAALFEAEKLRWFAVTHLIATGLFFAIGAYIVSLLPRYQGSVPVYFETCLWPYALLFAAFIILRAAAMLMAIVGALAGAFASRLARYSAAVVVAAIALSAAGFDIATAALPHGDNCASFRFPMRPTPITRPLAETIALRPGAPFRGLVATIDGVGNRPSVSWFDFAAYDGRLVQETGNDHRSVGLWHFGIPTLFQYFTFITPPYYLLLTDFLARPEDQQVRSVLVLTRLNEPMMRLWGVRYVITDSETEIGRQAAVLPVKDVGTLRLVELADPNLGNYSPTEIWHAADFVSGLRMLHAADFDGRRVVVTDSALAGPFVPATSSQLVYERDGLHLRAESTGQSVLVLPAQYSHCWSVQGSGQPTLFRADLMQLGIRFAGTLDARLIFRFGPILASACRLEDLHDMSRLRIREARVNPPRGAR